MANYFLDINKLQDEQRVLIAKVQSQLLHRTASREMWRRLAKKAIENTADPAVYAAAVDAIEREDANHG